MGDGHVRGCVVSKLELPFESFTLFLSYGIKENIG